jgi:hypothetical protein
MPNRCYPTKKVRTVVLCRFWPFIAWTALISPTYVPVHAYRYISYDPYLLRIRTQSEQSQRNIRGQRLQEGHEWWWLQRLERSCVIVAISTRFVAFGDAVCFSSKVEGY